MNLDLKRILGLASCFCLTIGSLVLGQEKRPLKPEDVVDIRTAGDVQISADGRWVAFVVTQAAEAARYEHLGGARRWQPASPVVCRESEE